MRRLEIVLIGHSLALGELAHELKTQGHLVQVLINRQALEMFVVAKTAVLIDDGSLELDGPQLEAWRLIERMSFRVGTRPPPDGNLVQVELLCWCGTLTRQRLIARQWLPVEASGNGRMTYDAAVVALVELGALYISGLSRDPVYLRVAPTVDAPQSEDQHSLLRLDQMLFEHRFNQNKDAHLLRLSETPLITRLDQGMREYGERIALSLGDQHVSYACLHAHSLAIQHLLIPLLDARTSGTTPVIGICMSKSATLFAGILAIMGCGAVYLPLDPDQPLQRQRYILENAGAVVLLHDGTHPLASAEFPALNIACVEPDESGQPLLRGEILIDSPCMALYTSGTTGQPKGVLLSQRNLSHFTAWYADYVGLSRQSRVLQFSTLSFDSSVIDIFPTLLCGAELVVASADQRRDPLLLLELLSGAVTHAFLPPALLSILPRDQPLSLQHLMTGGDVCEPDVIRYYAAACSFHNLYGPTEATVLITAGQFQPDSSNRNLGRPIANSQVLILDEQLLPVAEETPGELYIVGPGVGVGYIGNSTSTAERYVLLPQPGAHALRAYRTGDIGKWTAQGIELCGRRDNQVKIRGFRVEPEEIEHCLRTSQLCRQVAVVINERRQILAFLAQPVSATGLIEQLRAHVRAALPDYMHPQVYTLLPHMPFAANGKVDRKALLAMPVTLADQACGCLPKNDEERQLLDLWSELLGIPGADISTDESFFNLGGHSILLSRLLLGIRERFGRSVPINRFIEAPTVQTLAGLILSRSKTAATVSARAMQDANDPALDLPVLGLAQSADVHNVILTGANGFLGVHLVEALLAGDVIEIACLVRESATQSAQQRFTEALKENRLDHLDLSRVTVYPADVTQPRLGLQDAVYERLDRDFGVLIHNAANVNHVQDYETLVRDNVTPVLECLRLCEGRSKKVFNFVSTLSACSAVDDQGRVLEQPAAASPPIYIKNGYNLTKWVAERVLQRAVDRGVQVNIYRPGNIGFNSISGVCQPHKNRLLLMLKGSLQLGQVPQFSMNFDLMPVDFLARFIGFHASQYQAGHAVFNLHNPEPLSWMGYVDSFRETGRDFEMVSVSQWQTQLRRVDSQNALFGVLGFYLDGFEEDIGDISMIEYSNAQAGVRRMGGRYPQKDQVLLSKGCAYLKEINFI